MYKLEYEIKLDKDGSPYINLPDDYDNKPEDKFMALELTRYILTTTFNTRRDEFGKEVMDIVDNAVGLLGDISDEVGMLLVESMKNLGDIYLMMKNPYHIRIKNEEELENLEDNLIVYDGRIYERKDGLIVFNEETEDILILKNNKWEIKK